MRKETGVQSLAHMQVSLTFVKFHFIHTCKHVFLRNTLLGIIQYSKITINY